MFFDFDIEYINSSAINGWRGVPGRTDGPASGMTMSTPTDIQLTGSRRDGERVSYSDLAQALRVHIVTQGIPPDSRLPTRQELTRQLGGSSATLQRAINELIEEGFLVTRGRAGTFVSKRLPHQCRVGLLFPPMPPGTSELSRFWETLKQQTELLDPDGPIQMQVYHDVEPREDNAGYQRLLEDLNAHRLGGVMTMCMPSHALDDALAQAEADVARVALMGPGNHGIPHVTLEPYHERVVQEAVRRGRRSMALIYPVTDRRRGQAETIAQWRAAGDAAGIETRSYWMFPVHPGAPVSARHAAELLLRSSPRPDVIAILDDHLVEEATRGVHSAGVRVPDDVLVFAHSNFPDRPASCVPVQRIGYDISELLNCGLDLLWRQLQGEQVAAEHRLEPVTDGPLSYSGRRDEISLDGGMSVG